MLIKPCQTTLKFVRVLECEKHKMSGSSVGDSNREYVRRNGEGAENKREIRGEGNDARNRGVFERVTPRERERGRGNNLANNGN